jgi:ATP-dependent Clp protease, protease subunit
VNLKVKNKVGDTAELYIYGDIVDNTDWKWDEYDVMPDDVKSILDQINDTNNLNIYINSGGGSVFGGLAIYNMLKRHKAYKTVHVDGIAASIASVIALAGDRVIIPSNAYFMIHKAWTFGGGNSTDLRALADTLDKIDEGILNVYKENLKEGVDIKSIEKMVAAETWMTGEEVTQYFNVETSESVNVAASASDYYAKYSKTPLKIVDNLESEKPNLLTENSEKEAGNEQIKPEIEENPLENNMEIEELLMELDLI